MQIKRYFTILKEGLGSLRVHKLRAFLAMLGVIIGVAAVIAIVAFGEGNEIKLRQEIAKLGPDIFWVGGGYYYSGDDDRETRNKRKLTMSDVIAIEENCTLLRRISPQTSFWSRIVLNSKQFWVEVIGTNSEFKEIMDMKLIRGRFLQETDLRNKRRVCVVEASHRLNKYLAPRDPVGRKLNLNGLNYTVIGLLDKRTKEIAGRSWGTVYIPLTTAKYITTATVPEKIYLQASRSQVKQAMLQTEDILKSRRRGEDFFDCSNREKEAESAEKMTRTASMVTGGIAMISLLVGSIGIMNIMLVTVSERTKEIGTRICLGARKRDILTQFLFEAILLTSIGGLIGIGFGSVLARTIASVAKIPAVFSADAALIGFLFSVVIGVLSGFYPARKASRLNPIEALRHE